ncbi:hypothetical protein CEXT_296481 [Caerostris extrusa]|uniref:Uncharacterized protein n=1 Tax=Caerostris extrusa TaxID=172846 RepID=A0AAV4NX44_CAEEX|nr:hypothetical protein CEXT_296481 [Caerostris extrusa]
MTSGLFVKILLHRISGGPSIKITALNSSPLTAVASHASNSKLWNPAPEHSDAFDPRGGAYKNDFRHCNLMKGFPHFRYPTEHACDT